MQIDRCFRATGRDQTQARSCRPRLVAVGNCFGRDKRKRAQVGHDLLRFNIITPQFYPSTLVEKRFPDTCVPRPLYSPVLCSPCLCSQVPMFPGPYMFLDPYVSRYLSRSSSLSLHDKSSASAIFYNSLLSIPWLTVATFSRFFLFVKLR